MSSILNIVGLLAALVLFFTAVRMFEISPRAEISPYTLLACLLGLAAVWSIVDALDATPLEPSHVLLLVCGALRVLANIGARRQAGEHPMRRRNDMLELPGSSLDEVAGGQK